MSRLTLPLVIVIIAASILIMLGKLGVIEALLYWLWPLLLIAAGAACYLYVWSRSLPSQLFVAAAVCLSSGLVFMVCVWFGWYWLRALWPAILLSGAVGLYQYAEAERLSRLRTISWLVGIGLLLTLVVTMMVYMNGFIVLLLLVVIGVFLLSRRPHFR